MNPTSNDGWRFEPKQLLNRRLSGRYLLQNIIGLGSFGAVFKTVDLQTQKDAAAKVLLKPTDKDGLNRFLFEADVMVALRHKNIVSILGEGVDREIEHETGLPYIIMEYIDGPDLSKVLASRIAAREGPFTPKDAVEIGGGILLGLHFVHQHNVVHGDLNPSNVLMGAFPKLVDFGLSVLANARQTSGHIAGTPSYMAPEVVKGYPANQLSDLYSFGCTLYELITGHPPIGGGTAEDIMKNQLVDEPFPLSATGARVKPAMDALVLSLLSKDPAKRPASIPDLYWRLRGAV